MKFSFSKEDNKMGNKMYKSIKRWGLVALVGVAVLTSCTPEEQDTNSVGFFKISVAADEFKTAGIDTRSQVTAQCDTVITPVDDNLYMETVFVRETATVKTRATSSTLVAAGTKLTILVYRSDDTYINQFDATVLSNGSISTETLLRLEPGKYKFVCVVGAEVYETLGEIQLHAITKCMAAMIERTIKPQDSDCKLEFILKQLTGQISIQVKSEGLGEFIGLTTKLIGTPTSTVLEYTLPDLIEKEDTNFTQFGGSFFTKITGSDIISSGRLRYHFKRRFVPNSVKFQFTEGTINGIPLSGREIIFKNFEINIGVISKVVVTFKQQKPVPPAIDSTPSEDWGDIPLTPGNDIELTL